MRDTHVFTREVRSVERFSALSYYDELSNHICYQLYSSHAISLKGWNDTPPLCTTKVHPHVPQV